MTKNLNSALRGKRHFWSVRPRDGKNFAQNFVQKYWVYFFKYWEVVDPSHYIKILQYLLYTFQSGLNFLWCKDGASRCIAITAYVALPRADPEVALCAALMENFNEKKKRVWVRNCLKNQPTHVIVHFTWNLHFTQVSWGWMKRYMNATKYRRVRKKILNFQKTQMFLLTFSKYFHKNDIFIIFYVINQCQ